MLKDMTLTDKRVLIRVDFNVPLEDGVVKDDYRIRKALPTIRYVLKKNPRQVILISHLGRPKGEYRPEFSLRPVSERCSELLGRPIFFESNPRINNINDLSTEPIVMLENLRFDEVEKANDEFFAKKLASFADVFVFDAFGAAHRAHASVVGVPKFIPSCMGLLMEKEVHVLKDEMQHADHPFVAIIGGAKKDKINVIDSLLLKVDRIIIGGVLANTFLKASGQDIGGSKYSEEDIPFAQDVLRKYSDKIALPVDYIIGDSLDADANARCVGQGQVGDWMILDIGPYTRSGYKKILDNAKTIVWAGPIGVFEHEKFRQGTWDIASHVAQKNALKVIGGGDSGEAIRMLGLEDKMTHVSTGGGASLELLAGHELPALKALEENHGRFK